MQLQLALIPHQVDRAIIPQRADDGYVNATAMCNAAGKLFADYARLQTTRAFLEELALVSGRPIGALVVVRQGGIAIEQGTWVHPDVAINLGQWCSPKFAVAVSTWVREWLTGKARATAMPYHIDRYMANASKIPHTHFSMLNELTLGLIAPLELQGYSVPEHMVPDISEGKMFCRWLREVKKVNTSDFPTYEHVYADGRVVLAKLYPNSMLEDFRKHFNEVWIPSRMLDYFKERDPIAIAHFPKAFPRLFGGPKKLGATRL